MEDDTQLGPYSALFAVSVGPTGSAQFGMQCLEELQSQSYVSEQLAGMRLGRMLEARLTFARVLGIFRTPLLIRQVYSRQSLCMCLSLRLR